jgi:hypothetical protein
MVDIKNVFFKYLCIHTLLFEIMCADDVVCSNPLSAKPDSDNIFWNKLDEIFFRLLITTTFLQIFSNKHLLF